MPVAAWRCPRDRRPAKFLPGTSAAAAELCHRAVKKCERRPGGKSAAPWHAPAASWDRSLLQALLIQRQREAAGETRQQVIARKERELKEV